MKTVVHKYRFMGNEHCLHDHAELKDIDSLVRSGDYFSVLATVLDSLCISLNDSNAIPVIEGLIRDLLYVESKYKIEPKATS